MISHNVDDDIYFFTHSDVCYDFNCFELQAMSVLMGDQQLDTPLHLRSSDIERKCNRRTTLMNSRWARSFSPCEENEADIDESTNQGFCPATIMSKKRYKVINPDKDYDSNNFSLDDEQRAPPRLTTADIPDDYQWSDDRCMEARSNSPSSLSPRQNARNFDDFSESLSDRSENESEDIMDLSDYEGKKEEFAKKWSIIVEGGRFSKSKPSLKTVHRVNADLDRYEKGAGIINYNITVKKITKTDSHIQFSSDLRRPKRIIPVASTPKSTTGKSSWRSSSWKPPRRSSYRESLTRESSLSPRRRRILSNASRFSGKFSNANDFSPSRSEYFSPRHINVKITPPPSAPRPSGRRFTSPPPRRSHSSGNYRIPVRNADSDSRYHRVNFADVSTSSCKTSRSSLTRHQRQDVGTNISNRYATESPSRRSNRRFSNGRWRSQSPPRASKSFAEQIRKFRLEGQEADNPFSIWDPDSSRWSRDFESSFDEFMGPRSSGFVEDEDTSSGSLFTDEMEFNSRKRLSPSERNILFHTWNPVFYCNESPGYINDNIAKTSMIDPRYRVFY